MKTYRKELLGSELKIALFDKHINPDDIEQCFAMTQAFEKKYSRFITGNFLDKLNTDKISTNVDAEFLSLVKLCLHISQLSEGYFDITLVPVLENLGYGKFTTPQKVHLGHHNIVLSKNTIELKNGVSIEIGGAGKGFAVDQIYNFLSNKYEHFIINFGGDIRIQGRDTFLLEDPNDDTRHIGKMLLHDSALASSGKNKRKTTRGHHLIDPKKASSSSEKMSVFVLHPLATFADIFATTLFVCPLELSIRLINTVPNLEALMILENGEIYKSKGFDCTLYH